MNGLDWKTKAVIFFMVFLEGLLIFGGLAAGVMLGLYAIARGLGYV